MNALALRLFAIDPAGLGGLLVRGRAGPARDELVACVRAMMADAAREQAREEGAEAMAEARRDAVRDAVRKAAAKKGGGGEGK